MQNNKILSVCQNTVEVGGQHSFDPPHPKIVPIGEGALLKVKRFGDRSREINRCSPPNEGRNLHVLRGSRASCRVLEESSQQSACKLDECRPFNKFKVISIHLYLSLGIFPFPSGVFCFNIGGCASCAGGKDSIALHISVQERTDGP